MRHKRGHFETDFMDDDLDLVPMIDCIFLLLLFFMLCGRIAMDQRNEMISVPPTKTSRRSSDNPAGYERVIISIYGRTQDAGAKAAGGQIPRNSIKIGDYPPFHTAGTEKPFDGYIKFRDVLNEIWVKANKEPDSKNPQLQIPKVILELRADSDTEYRVVQEVQQVATDTMDPNKSMTPKMPQMPFIFIDFTTRPPVK